MMKKLILGMLAFLLVSINSMGNNSQTADFHGKINVSTTGDGKVYVSNSDDATSTVDGDWKDGEFSQTLSVSGSSNATSVNITFYLHAKPSEDNFLSGWFYTDANNNIQKLNGNTVSLAATSKDKANPTEVPYTYHAVFIPSENDPSLWNTEQEGIDAPHLYRDTKATEVYAGDNTNFAVGKVLYRQYTDLENGFYRVRFYAFASRARGENVNSGANIAQAFAKTAKETSVQSIIVREEGWVNDPEWNGYLQEFIVEVTDGTLEYGIQNVAEGGNWYFCEDNLVEPFDPIEEETAIVNMDEAYVYTIIDNQYMALGIGATYGTRATLINDTPVKVEIATDETTKQTTFKFKDNEYLYDAGGYALYTDRATSNQFVLLPQKGGGYKIHIPNDMYYAIGHEELEDGNIVMRLVASADADVFYFGDNKVQLAISKLGVGTFIAPHDCVTPDNIKAYTVDVNSEGTLKKTLSNNGIKANTAYLVKSLDEDGEPLAYSTYLYGQKTNGAKIVYTTEAMTGNLGDPFVVTPNAGNYLLQYNDGVLGFYKVADEGLKIGKNRCYLTTTSSNTPAGVKQFFALDDEDVDAISTPTVAEKNDGAIYDLSGRRLSSKPSKGLYIINGKKVMVK